MHCQAAAVLAQRINLLILWRAIILGGLILFRQDLVLGF